MQRRIRRRTGALIAGVVALTALASALPQATGQQQQAASPSDVSTGGQRDLLKRYCLGCHNDRLETGGLSLEAVDLSNVGEHAEVWEQVVRKLRGGIMPPIGRPRPPEAAYDSFAAYLEAELDRAAAVQPNPGRTETLHRLNRAEYRNTIRDLLGLELDIADFLPADDSSYGFDNIAGVLRMSQSLMERYLTAARIISRMAVGTPPPAVDSAVYRIASDMPRQDRQDGLPFGTRGGLLIDHFFRWTPSTTSRFKSPVPGRSVRPNSWRSASTGSRFSCSRCSRRSLVADWRAITSGARRKRSASRWRPALGLSG